MSTTDTNWFGGLGTAAADGRSTYVHPGTYLVRVENIVRKTSKKPGVGRMVIVEMTILDVLVAYEADPGPPRFAASNVRGERAGQWIMLDKPESSPLEKLKGFLLPFTGLSAADGSDEEWAQIAMDLTDPAQPWAERSLGMNHELILVAGKTTTGSGGPYTTITWLPVPDEAEAA